jgi:tetratricopeptide (TPR) repeat protein
VPFEIVKVPFENFGQARNASLDACRAGAMDFDFILLADADLELHVEPNASVARQLEYPAHQILQRAAGGTRVRARADRASRPAGKYVGVSHEVLDVGYRGRHALKSGTSSSTRAAKDMSAKHQKDVELFTEEVKKRPDDTRSTFDPANALYWLGRHEEAIRWYRRRIELGGWQEEVFYSHYRIPRCMLALEREADFFHQRLLAFDAFPDRAEPLHLLAARCMETKRHRLGYHLASIAAGVPARRPTRSSSSPRSTTAHRRRHGGLRVLHRSPARGPLAQREDLRPCARRREAADPRQHQRLQGVSPRSHPATAVRTGSGCAILIPPPGRSSPPILHQGGWSLAVQRGREPWLRSSAFRSARIRAVSALWRAAILIASIVSMPAVRQWTVTTLHPPGAEESFGRAVFAIGKAATFVRDEVARASGTARLTAGST